MKPIHLVLSLVFCLALTASAALALETLTGPEKVPSCPVTYQSGGLEPGIRGDDTENGKPCYVYAGRRHVG